jgi:hypothetical protein
MSVSTKDGIGEIISNNNGWYTVVLQDGKEKKYRLSQIKKIERTHRTQRLRTSRTRTPRTRTRTRTSIPRTASKPRIEKKQRSIRSRIIKRYINESVKRSRTKRTKRIKRKGENNRQTSRQIKNRISNKKAIIYPFTHKNDDEYFNQYCHEKKYFDFNAPRIQSNPLFPNFFQSIFHAGNQKQFTDAINFETRIKPFENNKLRTYATHVSTLNNFYISEKNIMDTFNYFFNVLKKGIFVQIFDNKLQTFIPFNNANYKNEWGQFLKGPYGKDPVRMEIEHAKFKRQLVSSGPYKTKICTDKNRWYANYFMFKNQVFSEGPLKELMDEGDHATEDFKCLIEEVCNRRFVPDICFFMNPRDYPVLKKNLDHPYDLIYRSAGKQVPKIQKPKIPILSQSATDEYDDIIIPNEDDINRLLCNNSEHSDQNKDQNNIELNWENKKNIAIFRGSATGAGITKESNQRIKLASMKNEILDVALTGGNNRLKLDPILGYCDYINLRKLGIELGQKKTIKEQSEYKYIIHVSGHVAAFRLSREFGYNSLIIKVDSPWKVWFSDKINGFTIQELENKESEENVQIAHYIKAKSDLSDINEIVTWCINNDTICKQIAKNGYDFFTEFLSTKDYMLDYTNDIFWSISKNSIIESEESEESEDAENLEDSEFEDWS